MRLSVNSRHTHDEGYIHWLPHKPLLFAEKPDKLKAGFKKFNYEAEFVKETKQEDKK